MSAPNTPSKNTTEAKEVAACGRVAVESRFRWLFIGGLVLGIVALRFRYPAAALLIGLLSFGLPAVLQHRWCASAARFDLAELELQVPGKSFGPWLTQKATRFQCPGCGLATDRPEPSVHYRCGAVEYVRRRERSGVKGQATEVVYLAEVPEGDASPTPPMSTSDTTT